MRDTAVVPRLPDTRSDSGQYPLRRLRYINLCTLFLPGPSLRPAPLSTAYTLVARLFVELHLDGPARVWDFFFSFFPSTIQPAMS